MITPVLHPAPVQPSLVIAVLPALQGSTSFSGPPWVQCGGAELSLLLPDSVPISWPLSLHTKEQGQAACQASWGAKELRLLEAALNE